MPPRPGVVLFDVNETLFGLDPVRHRFDRSGLGSDLVDAWFASVLRDGFAVALTDGFAPFPDIAAHHLRRLAVGRGLDDPVDVAEHVIAGFDEVRLHDDVVPALRRLRDAGVRAATLTNGSVAITRGALERGGALDLVDTTLEVGDAGVWKPAAGAYRWAAARLGVAVDEVTLVAVHPWDVHGAVHAGAGGAWCNRDGERWPDFLTPPPVEGPDLAAVVTTLIG